MTMRSMVVLVAVLGAGAAHADASPAFAKVRDAAEALGGLGPFLDKYMGRCGSVLEGGGDCQRNAETFRRAANGKKYYMIITEDSAANLSLGGNDGKSDFTLNLTPFFPGSDSAVTHGAPSKTDANGNPVLPFIAMKGTLPDGWNMAMLARQLQARAMRIQVVFTPLGSWTLPKKGGGTIKGVKARLDAVLVSVGRTGEEIAIWTGH